MRTIVVGHVLVRIYNKKRDRIPPNAQYVGRPSILGNPYSHRPHSLAEHRVGTAEEAVAKYEEYATARAKSDPEFRSALKAVYMKDLICWCDGPCHAVSVALLAKQVVEEDAQHSSSHSVGINT